MKFVISINQQKMIENNLNVTQWCILDIISTASAWSETIIKDNEVYFWIARQKIAEELKAFDLKDDTIYRNIKTLSELNFIEYIKYGKKDLIRLSDKGKGLFTMSETNPSCSKNSETNPSFFGNRSEFRSEIDPTYKYTKDNKDTNDKREIDLPAYISKETWEEWIKFRKQLKKPLTELSVQKQLKFLSECQAKNQNPNLIIEQSIQNGWLGLFELKKNMSLLDRCVNENSRTYEIADENNPF